VIDQSQSVSLVGPHGPDGLDVRDVVAWYGQAQVLFEVNIAVRPGEIVGVFGHNGAGKSTLLRVIAGLHRHAEYESELNGVRLDRRHPHVIARAGLVLVREGARVFEGLSVEEHLQLGRRLGREAGRGAQSLEATLDLFPALSALRRRPASQLSGGQRQILSLATAFASNPLCLLLDEPSTGLSPQALGVLSESLETLAAKAMPLLVTEQNPEWLARLATRAYLLTLGRVEASGVPAGFMGGTN
jgi:branched-chain amino acid transport system ATP-binding protein